MQGIQLKGISISFGARECLKDVELSFLRGERLALSGVNGSGKSTLLKIIAGALEPDGGEIVASKEARISYLPQSHIVQGDDTLGAEAEKAFLPLAELAENLRGLEKEISELAAGSPRLQGLLEKHHALQERLEASGYFLREKKIAQVLAGLGFSSLDAGRPCAGFSLGWQMRIALAKVLLEDPDFLLLDEPTNYLDLEARLWLLDFLSNFSGGIIIVSHDRYFLDHTIGAVAELLGGRLRVYKGTYSHYEVVRAQELERLIEEHRQVEEERERSETFIRRFRAQASKAALVQSRIKLLEKLPVIEIPAGIKKLKFHFPDPPHSGRRTLLAEGLAKSYTGSPVFSDLGFEIERGEKIVVVGVNGAGKSTLLRILSGREASDRGQVLFGEGVTSAYFSSDTQFQLDDSRTVLDILEAIAPTELFPRLRTLLGAFLFSGDDAFKPVGVLSGGEQNRLMLLSLLLRPANLLILDEPTNHLDMASKDVLLDALRRFNGSVIFVSHDRGFIEGLAHKVLELDGHKARLFAGDYQYYLSRKETEQALAPPKADNEPASRQTAGGRQDHQSQKRERNLLKKIERQVEETLERIEALHQERATLELRLADEKVYRDGTLVREVKAALAKNEEEEAMLFTLWQTLEQEKTELER